MWFFLVLAVAANGFVMVVTIRLRLMARAGKSGTEIIQLGLAPVYLAAYVLTYIGGFCGIRLSGLLTGPIRIVAGVLGGVLLGLSALGIVGFLHERLSARKLDRVISQDEMLALVRAHEIKSITKQHDGTVTFIYANNWQDGKYIYRPTKADPDGYPAYVTAANEIRRGQGYVITYRNENDPLDPLSPGGRWITAAEATDLLNDNEIRTFAYGSPSSGWATTPMAGDPTGIKLNDHGWVRHMYVDAANEALLIPIAREAQHRHGKPYFIINDRPETQSN
ncbi:hypothetical protein [Actinocrispum sp. NPDC049592]|uniref:hypothetical protein n=1 Tax=Actinocrispum sp. NPDC049592 TaxID=3154835 RepID=UPI0034396FFF